jgi:uncharacterized protein YndB with AHSA1/START domain
MTNTATETLSVVVEREIPFPPEKIWRALTQPHLIEQWLMKNDFKPVQQQAYQGAKYGWQKFFANLEQVLKTAE